MRIEQVLVNSGKKLSEEKLSTFLFCVFEHFAWLSPLLMMRLETQASPSMAQWEWLPTGRAVEALRH